MADKRWAIELWRRHLAEAGLSDPGDAVGRKLAARYAAPWRRYHGLGHLKFLLGEIDRLGGTISDTPRLRFAAWFHDAVYVTWRKDNETRSARWALAALDEIGAEPSLADAVARLIEATADHANANPADQDDALFLDMDTAILGAPAEVYDRYARNVRFEYFWVPGPLYRKGRGDFLQAQTRRQRIFHTDLFERERADQARANMRRELGSLGRSAAP